MVDLIDVLYALLREKKYRILQSFLTTDFDFTNGSDNALHYMEVGFFFNRISNQVYRPKMFLLRRNRDDARTFI